MHNCTHTNNKEDKHTSISNNSENNNSSDKHTNKIVNINTRTPVVIIDILMVLPVIILLVLLKTIARVPAKALL